MEWFQIKSVAPPLDRPELAARLSTALRRADAMGLLAAAKQPIERLDVALLRKLLRPVGNAGIARQPLAELAVTPPAVDRLTGALDRLNDALLESPAPAREWPRAEAVLGPDLLARLLHISESSLRRYRARARKTPDDVAERLHVLALLTSDLGGAYNDAGVRRWFDRPRPQLGGKTPAELLRKDWRADDEGARRVRALAESLVASPAT